MHILRPITIILTIWLFHTQLPVLADHASSNPFSDHDTTTRPGIQVEASGDCPKTHTSKGNYTTYNGGSCIYHMPHQRFYRKTNAEQCYVTEEALKDGYRKSKR